MALLEFLPKLGGNFKSTGSGETPLDDTKADDKSSDSGDVKELNAHAIEETSTLENEGGAAVELITPIGRNIGWFSAFFINVGVDAL